MEGNKTEKINLADISRWDIFVKHYISPRSYDWVLAALRDLDPIGSWSVSGKGITTKNKKTK